MMGRARKLPGPDHIGRYVAQALAVEGGHLLVTEGGWVLHFASGAKLHGHDLAGMKARCTDAGLPVIDCRCVRSTSRLRSCLDWPCVAVGEPPDRHCWPSVPMPLAYAAALYSRAGAEVRNLDLDGPAVPLDDAPGSGRHPTTG